MTFTSLHWGAYRPQVVDGKLQALKPVEWDSDPSPIGDSVAEAITSPTRVMRPAVRRSFLEQQGGSPQLRGQEPFVEVSWDDALDLVANELRRVKAQHGNQAIFGGSYGWGSAGRFHHAQSQLHRFLNGFGGYVYSTDSYSLGAGRVLMPHIVGNMDWLLAAHTSWKNLAEHCELFVAFGGLPAKNADIVLPATTALERNDIGSSASDRFMIAMQQAIAPVGESRDDYSIFADLATRLDFAESFTEGRDAEAWLRAIYEESRGRAEDFGVELPDYDQFWRDGLFEVVYPQTDTVLLKAFRDDPHAHPLPTLSGRIEIFSERIAGFGYADCRGHPVWLDKPAPEAPLHLLSNQPKTRLHSQYDHGSYSRASKIRQREPLTLNPLEGS